MEHEYMRTHYGEKYWDKLCGKPMPEESTPPIWKENYLLQQQYIEELERELNAVNQRIRRLEEEVDKNISLKTSSYLNANPGSFTPSEWLDLLLACQDGRTTCMRVLQIIEREMDFIRNPKKHVFWGAGEQDCPKDIKAPNGELHTLMCKICGEKSPKYAECKSSNRI